MKRKRFLSLLALLVFFLLNLRVGPLYGVDTVDYLRLTGIVKSVDLNSGLIVVDVKSQSCPGERTFRFNTFEAGLSSDISDRKIRFLLNSSVCIEGERHEIISFIRK